MSATGKLPSRSMSVLAAALSLALLALVCSVGLVSAASYHFVETALHGYGGGMALETWGIASAQPQGISVHLRTLLVPGTASPKISRSPDFSVSCFSASNQTNCFFLYANMTVPLSATAPTLENSAFAFDDSTQRVFIASATFQPLLKSCKITCTAMSYTFSNAQQFTPSTFDTISVSNTSTRCDIQAHFNGIGEYLVVSVFDGFGDIILVAKAGAQDFESTWSVSSQDLFAPDTPILRPSFIASTPEQIVIANFGANQSTQIVKLTTSTGMNSTLSVPSLLNGAVELQTTVGRYNRYQVYCVRNSSENNYCSGFYIDELDPSKPGNILSVSVSNVTSSNMEIKTFRYSSLMCIAVQDRPPVGLSCQTFAEEDLSKDVQFREDLRPIPNPTHLSFDMGSSSVVCVFAANDTDSAFECSKIYSRPYFAIPISAVDLPELFTTNVTHNLTAFYGIIGSEVASSSMFNVSASESFYTRVELTDPFQPRILASESPDGSSPFALDGSTLLANLSYTFWADDEFYVLNPDAPTIGYVYFILDDNPASWTDFNPPYSYQRETSATFTEQKTVLFGPKELGPLDTIICSSVVVADDDSGGCVVIVTVSLKIVYCAALGFDPEDLNFVGYNVSYARGTYNVSACEIAMSPMKNCKSDFGSGEVVSPFFTCPSYLPSPAPSPEVRSPSYSCPASASSLPLACMDSGLQFSNNLTIQNGETVLLDVPVSILGNVTVRSGGEFRIARGSHVNIQGSLTFEPASKAILEAGGAAVQVSNCVDLNGTLFLNGTYSVGDSVTVLQYGCRRNTFDNVQVVNNSATNSCLAPKPTYSATSCIVLFVPKDGCPSDSIAAAPRHTFIPVHFVSFFLVFLLFFLL